MEIMNVRLHRYEHQGITTHKGFGTISVRYDFIAKYFYVISSFV